MQKQESAKESRDDESIDVTPYNLVTHADRRTSKDFLERSLMAAFLLKCLQRIGFFAQPTPDNGNDHRQSLLTRELLLSSRVFNFEIICRISGEKCLLARVKDELSIQQIVGVRAARRSTPRPRS